jgi:hypothetical protein
MFRYLRPLPFEPMNPIELNVALQSDPLVVILVGLRQPDKREGEGLLESDAGSELRSPANARGRIVNIICRALK